MLANGSDESRGETSFFGLEFGCVTNVGSTRRPALFQTHLNGTSSAHGSGERQREASRSCLCPEFVSKVGWTRRRAAPPVPSNLGAFQEMIRARGRGKRPFFLVLGPGVRVRARRGLDREASAPSDLSKCGCFPSEWLGRVAGGSLIIWSVARGPVSGPNVGSTRRFALPWKLPRVDVFAPNGSGERPGEASLSGFERGSPG